MREIKFRAWDKELGVIWEMWATEEGYYFFHPEHRGTANNDFYREIGEVFLDMNRFITLQYTGLKDKNGKEIYEGDIVETPRDGKAQVKIEENLIEVPDEYECCSSEKIRMVGTFLRDKDGKNIQLSEFDEIEIIGNIYENHNLLANETAH